MSVVPAVVPAPSRPWSETLRLYVDITRPRVIGLVVFTGLPALAFGEGGWPEPARAVWILLGTGLAGGASSALNAYFERETDARMARTRSRPLPAATLLPGVVVAYGLLLTAASTLILGWVGGALAVAVSLGTIAFYVGVYTLWLKPRTPQNIVIGGAAGSTAPLIAAAAVSGSIPLGAWVMAALIFLWTPPHFWAIALVRKKEYANAGFPMMPLVVGDQPTRWRSLAYAVSLLPVSMLPVWSGDLGAIYALPALALGLWFVGAVVRSLRAQDPVADWSVFRVSIAHLFLLFTAMAADRVLRHGPGPL